MPKPLETAVAARLRQAHWHLPALGAATASPGTYDVRKTKPRTLDVLATGERYRLCRSYLCRISERDNLKIGGVRLGVEIATRRAYVFKEIARTPAAARTLRHLHDEQRFGVQADSDVAGRTLLRSASREYLVLPVMAGDLESLRHVQGRGRTAAMLMGMRAVLQDLQRCHARGVAHRDIKPGNILHRGTPESLRLCDFGLSQALQAPANHTGTAHHMAPEQHRTRMGQQPNHDPAAADVWGVGATFLDVWVGNPFVCPHSAERSALHEAYAAWHAGTDSWWRWRVGGLATLGFAWAFGKLPAAVRPLFLQLLHPDAECRPNVDEALAQVESLLAQTCDHDAAAGHYERAAQAMCEAWKLD